MDIKKLLQERSYVNLDIEGGSNVQKGFLTMNSTDGVGVDVVWDYNKLPYPFPDDSMTLLRADRVLQKIERNNGHFIDVMNELWRITKYEGELMICVPYAGSYQYYQDPCAVNPMNEALFAYFDPLEPLAGKELYKVYKPKPWKIKHISFKVNGLMEVLLEKRKEDVSYGR